MRRDSIFYQLFKQSPILLFELLPQLPNRANDYTFESIEIKETAFRIDGVFMPPTAEGIVFFGEVQFQKDESLYERMGAEIGLFVYRNLGRFSNWQAVVIYPTKTVEQSDARMVWEWLESGRITRVYLDELGSIPDLPIGLGLMVLTILEGDEAKSNARELIERSNGDRSIIEMISTIVVYKFNTLSRDEVDAMLGIELQQTRIYQDAKAEGAVGEARSLILRQLTRKMGNVVTQVEARIEALPLAKLDELGEALLDFQGMNDLLAWLDRN